MTAPTTALLDFFKTAGDATAAACSWQEAKERCERFLARATDYAHDAMRDELSLASKLSAVDDAVAMCTGAVFAAHGMTLKAEEGAFKHPQAIASLAAELELSEVTVEPLVGLRKRVAELLAIPVLRDEDTFLAHAGAFTAASLVEWSTEHVHAVLGA